MMRFRNLAILIGLIGPLPAALIPGARAADAAAVSPLWHTRCDKDGSGRTACVVEQFAIVMPQNVVAAHVRLSATDRPDQMLMQLTVPLGVLLARGLVLNVDDTAPIELAFERCVAAGCLASAVLDKTALAMLTHGNTLTVRYVVSAGAAPLNIPLRLQGLAEALNQPAQKK